MNISSVLSKYGAAGIQRGVWPLPGGQKEASSTSPTFRNSADKVTISQEAKAAASALKGGNDESPADSLVKTYLNQVYGDSGDPAEREKEMEEWKERQLLDREKPGEPAEESQAKKDFRKLMDKMLGRGVIGGAKSPEEKIKELTEQIKTVKSRISEIATDQSLPEGTRANLVQALTAQVNGLYAQIAELSKTIAAPEAGKSSMEGI
jgi:hypothetical protein